MQMEIRIVRLTTSVAEVAVTVRDLPPGTPRGDLVGPRCPGRSTIEIAYPIRFGEVKDGAVSGRVVVPEPCLWSDAVPFEYVAKVEVGEEKDRAETAVQLRRE